MNAVHHIILFIFMAATPDHHKQLPNPVQLPLLIRKHKPTHPDSWFQSQSSVPSMNSPTFLITYWNPVGYIWPSTSFSQVILNLSWPSEMSKALSAKILDTSCCIHLLARLTAARSLAARNLNMSWKNVGEEGVHFEGMETWRALQIANVHQNEYIGHTIMTHSTCICTVVLYVRPEETILFVWSKGMVLLYLSVTPTTIRAIPEGLRCTYSHLPVR